MLLLALVGLSLDRNVPAAELTEDGDGQIELAAGSGIVTNVSGVTNGQASVPLPVPNDPSYSGVVLYAQALELDDGASHAVDSSDMAFQTACRATVREFYGKGKPVALEPLMLVSIEGPGEYQGDIIKTLMQTQTTTVTSAFPMGSTPFFTA